MATTPTSSRFFFIDLLRGWAVLMMIETHTLNSYMDFSLRSEAWFWYVNFINGLVAPTFIFISGFAFRIVTDRKWDMYLSFTPVFKKQLRRLLFILALAYSMHLPFALLKDWTITMPEGFAPFFRVDVLHTIALSLIGLQFLVYIFKQQSRVFVISIIVGCLFVFGAPFAYQHDFVKLLGDGVGNYINNLHGSLFPVFPWAAFAFFGYATAHFFMKEHKQQRSIRFIQGLSLASLCGVVLSLLFYFLPIRIFPEYSFWITSPSWFFVRLALVCLLLSLMWYYEHNFFKGKFSLVGMFGQRSLLVYTMHLAMIYGTFGLPKLSISNFHYLSLWMSLGTTVFILLVMFMLTYWWNRPRSERKLYWKYFAAVVVLWALGAIFWQSIVQKIEPVPPSVASGYIVIK